MSRLKDPVIETAISAESRMRRMLSMLDPQVSSALQQARAVAALYKASPALRAKTWRKRVRIGVLKELGQVADALDDLCQMLTITGGGEADTPSCGRSSTLGHKQPRQQEPPEQTETNPQGKT